MKKVQTQQHKKTKPDLSKCLCTSRLSVC